MLEGPVEVTTSTLCCRMQQTQSVTFQVPPEYSEFQGQDFVSPNAGLWIKAVLEGLRSGCGMKLQDNVPMGLPAVFFCYTSALYS